MSETSQEKTIIDNNGRFTILGLDSPMEYTEDKIGNGIPDENLDLHESFSSRSIVTLTKSVQPDTEAVETAQKRKKKKMK